MPDIFDQLAAKQSGNPLPPGADIFDQMAATSDPRQYRPGYPAPPNAILQNSRAPSGLSDAMNMANDAAKQLYQVSTPGMAITALKAKLPNWAAVLPKTVTDAAASPKDLPNQVLMTGLPMMFGDDVPPETNAAETGARATSETPGSTMSSRALEVAKRRAGNIPGVQAVKDAQYIATGAKPSAALEARSTPQPVPETNGIPWGTGGQGPIELRGKTIPSYRGAPLPEKPLGVGLQGANTPATTPASQTGEALAAIKIQPGTESTASQSGGIGRPIASGTLPKSTGDPYSFRNTPKTMEPIQSSNIGLAGYHAESKTMVVQFTNGKVYDYRGVPQEIYQQFKDAESSGSFFSREIKGRYDTNYRGSVRMPPASAGRGLGAAISRGLSQ